MPSYESLTASRPALERRIIAAIDATPSRIPVLIGDFRTGRTQLLYRIRERLGRTHCQHIDLERAATTPERFYQAITAASPFRVAPRLGTATARDAFDRCSRFSTVPRRRARACDVSADEVLRTAHVSRAFRGCARAERAAKGLTRTLEPLRPETRYVSRAHKLLREATARFESFTAASVVDRGARPDAGDRDGADKPAARCGRLRLARRSVHTLVGRSVGYAQANRGALSRMVDTQGVGIRSAPSPLCFCRRAASRASCARATIALHRARGYGALKANSEILAQEESAAPPSRAHRLNAEHPGSTKDYRRGSRTSI